MQSVNVICMKWGNLYNAEYVNKLYNSVKRNLTLDFNFYCFTEDSKDIDENIIIKPLPILNIPDDKTVSPWLKLAVYAKDFGELNGKSLFLDLDIIIVDNIDSLFSFSDKYTIAENWTQRGKNIGNSSVFCFNIGQYDFIYDKFIENPTAITDKYSNEQIYVSLTLIGQKDYYPSEWIVSFKKASVAKWLLRFFIEPKIPSRAKIIAFHGHPKPHEAVQGKWPGRIIPFMKKASWIRDYWK